MSSDQTTHLQRCLDRWHAGEDVAREELFRGACARLRLIAGKLFQSRRFQRWEDLEDLLQNASLQLWRSLENVRPTSARHFLNLGAQHIRWELINLTRRYFGPEGAAANQESLPAKDNVSTEIRTAAEPADSSGQPDDLATWTEFHERIETLPDSERELWNLLWYQGMKLTDAAVELGVAERVLRYRWQQARLGLVRALKRELPGTRPGEN
jgi:RNA polymerase sigma-70 factor (ECF subfamily)